MDYIVTTLDNLIHQTAFFNLTWGNYLMIVVACVFLYLAIAKEFEPLLLLPIAFGMLLVTWELPSVLRVLLPVLLWMRLLLLLHHIRCR